MRRRCFGNGAEEGEDSGVFLDEKKQDRRYLRERCDALFEAGGSFLRVSNLIRRKGGG